jgi:hypothetical protein
MVNKELCDIANYTEKQLLHRDVSAIIPNSIDSVIHNRMIENYFMNKQESNIVNKKRMVWLKNMFGFLRLVEIYIQPYYD